MARFVKEGHTVLNIGSHVGLEAMVLGKIAGPKGKLFIMEPFSISCNMLLKNVYLNSLNDITTIYNVGASNKYSKGYISVGNINTGGAGIFTD
jgi:FkbM family methyltransferase